MGGEAIESIPQRSSLRLLGFRICVPRRNWSFCWQTLRRRRPDQLSSLDGSDGQHFWGWVARGAIEFSASAVNSEQQL